MRPPVLAPGFLAPETPAVRRGPSLFGRILIATIRALPVRPGVRDSVYPRHPAPRGRLVGKERADARA